MYTDIKITNNAKMNDITASFWDLQFYFNDRIPFKHKTFNYSFSDKPFLLLIFSSCAKESLFLLKNLKNSHSSLSDSLGHKKSCIKKDKARSFSKECALH